jgi:hypothetical protein
MAIAIEVARDDAALQSARKRGDGSDCSKRAIAVAQHDAHPGGVAVVIHGEQVLLSIAVEVADGHHLDRNRAVVGDHGTTVD